MGFQIDAIIREKSAILDFQETIQRSRNEKIIQYTNLFVSIKN